MVNVCNVQGWDPLCKQYNRQCAGCNYIKLESVHPYTRNLLRVRNMREIGFQIDPDTLKYQQWLDMVAVESGIVQAATKKRGQRHGPK